MKRRLLILGITIIFALTLLPTAALAKDTVPNGYNEHDYNAMVNFLNQPSPVPGQTNAQRLGYDIKRPETWTDVVWSSDVEKRIVIIGYSFDNSDRILAGSLDLSNCTALEELDFIKTEVTELNVRGCTALTDLDCEENCLTVLDLSGCTALQSLQCCKNGTLATLDVSACPKLLSLACGETELTSLDVSKNTVLQDLYCRANQLATLDLRKNTALRSLDCGVNQLTSLDVSSNTALVELNCDNNLLTSLNVSNNTALESLVCSANQLASLDVYGLYSLEVLRCDESVTVTRQSPSTAPVNSAFPTPLPPADDTLIYLLCGFGLLVFSGTAMILIHRRRKTRNQ